MYIPKKSLATSLMVLMLSVFAFGTVYFLKFQTKYKSSASSPDSPPINVMISNPSESSFTVSWLTLAPTTGKVFYGTDSSSSNIKLVVGDATISTVHLINLENLNPETKYHFLLCSGDDCAPYKLYGLKPGANILGVQSSTDSATIAPTQIASPTATIASDTSNVQQGTGLPISFQTMKPSDSSLSSAIPVFGTAVLSQKNTESVILMSIAGANGESFPMTTTVDAATGNFSFEASNVKKMDLTTSYPVDLNNLSGFNLKLTAFWVVNGQLAKSEKLIPMTDFSPIKNQIVF